MTRLVGVLGRWARPLSDGVRCRGGRGQGGCWEQSDTNESCCMFLTLDREKLQPEEKFLNDKLYSKSTCNKSECVINLRGQVISHDFHVITPHSCSKNDCVLLVFARLGGAADVVWRLGERA